MKLLIPFTLLALLFSCEQPKTIKSSDIRDAAIISPKEDNSMTISKEYASSVYIDPDCEPRYARINYTYDRGDTIHGCLMDYSYQTLNYRHMIIVGPIFTSRIKGDSITDNWIELSSDFKGDAVFILNSERSVQFARNNIITNGNNVAFFKAIE